jgi:hypothetical protein
MASTANRARKRKPASTQKRKSKRTPLLATSQFVRRSDNGAGPIQTPALPDVVGLMSRMTRAAAAMPVGLTQARVPVELWLAQTRLAQRMAHDCQDMVQQAMFKWADGTLAYARWWSTRGQTAMPGAGTNSPRKTKKPARRKTRSGR